MFSINKTYSNIALKIFIVITFLFSSFFYGCSSEEDLILLWEDKNYYNIDDAREAVGNSVDKKLESVTKLSTPVFKSNLLIIVPSREMAAWAEEKAPPGNKVFGMILETALHMYASAVKKHNMFKKVATISSENKTADRTSFDYILHVKDLEPGNDKPIWAIKKTGYNIDMSSQPAAEDLFVTGALNTALDNLKITVSMIEEIVSTINEHETVEKFLKGKERSNDKKR